MNPSSPLNETPSTVTNTVATVWQYVEQYGWFIIGIAVAVLLLKNRLQPQLDRWRSQREDGRNKKIDPVEAQSRLEALERQRQRMQEMMDRQAEEFKQKQKEKEERARLERIADWENHEQGKGYKNKTRTCLGVISGQSCTVGGSINSKNVTEEKVKGN
ncbi:hypothetical protein C0Q70_12401 [Pomacea canaliculata]|uniref:Selenoprotein S n=1 Tax=Pomacea canaliculata TaxID=400727 RepID=A0A2T7P1F8_POMCA|nr:hypothetical protein C0Q70_12401 [Pomacea canaliculata]